MDKKSNEITAVPKLVQLLNLKESIVTSDAMGAQRKIAIEIIHQGADYLLALKGNQETLHDEVKALFEDPGSLEYSEERGAVVETETALRNERERRKIRYYLSSMTPDAAHHLDFSRQAPGDREQLSPGA